MKTTEILDEDGTAVLDDKYNKLETSLLDIEVDRDNFLNVIVWYTATDQKVEPSVGWPAERKGAYVEIEIAEVAWRNLVITPILTGVEWSQIYGAVAANVVREARLRARGL